MLTHRSIVAISTFVVVSTFVLLVALSPANAEPEAVTIGAAAHLGLGTPHGGVGISAEGTFSKRARLGVGIGYSLGGSPQYTAMVEALFGPQREFGLGVGASMGGYVWSQISGLECDDFCDERTWTRAYWLNAQASYRLRLGDTWNLSPYAGVSFMTNADDFECTALENDCSEEGRGSRLRYLGVSLGRSF